jgi:Tol biopolymer transport system component
MARCIVALAILAACNAHLGDPANHTNGPDGGTGGGSDAGGTPMVDAPLALGPWSTPAPVTGAADATNNEDDPTLSSDGLELYYAVAPPNGSKNLYRMTRTTRNDPFANPTPLTAFNTAGTDEGPRLSYDDLTIYFGTDGEIYQATRASKTAAWGAATKVPGVDTAAYEKWLAVCGDGSHFMVSRDNGANGQDLYEGTLGGGPGTRNDILSSTANDISTFLSQDCLTVYFASNRVTPTETQIYVSTRSAIGAAWSTPAPAPAPFSGGTDNEDAGYTPDNRLFVFATTRGSASKDVYLSYR